MRISQRISNYYQNNKKFAKAGVITLIVAVFVMLAGSALFGSYFVYGHDISMDYRFWHKIKTKKALVKGDYVLLAIWHENPFITDKMLIKQVACAPGDVLKTEPLYQTLPGEILRVNKYYCNDELLGSSLGKAKSGVLLTSIEYPEPYTLREGEYWVMGTHPRSYDSRYLGLVKSEFVLSELTPVRLFK